MNRVELRQLEQFVAVAEEAQFTRAARRLLIAQSALSTSIKALEREVGARLFDRTTRKVELTPAGQAFLVEARRTLAAAAGARDVVRNLDGVLRGRLDVGGVETEPVYSQACLLATFARRHPAVDIRYVRDSTTALVGAVGEARLDVAFVAFPTPPPAGVHALEERHDGVVFVCRPDHPLAGESIVRPEQLAGETSWIASVAGSVAFDLVSGLAAVGKVRRIPFQVNHAAMILQFVTEGLGVTAMAEGYMGRDDGLRRIPVDGVSFDWTLGLVAAPADRRSQIASAFIDLVDEGIGRSSTGSATSAR
jgi:DNA-binding transcriptional LysR family regulator